MKFRQFGVALAVWLLVVAVAAGANDIIDATVRIVRPDGALRGTGSIIDVYGGQVYILTCAHVARQDGAEDNTYGEPWPSMGVAFWRDGHASAIQPAAIVACDGVDVCDWAILTVDAAPFGASLPPAIPLAPPGYVLEIGQTIYSVGCAESTWATAFRGHLVEIHPRGFVFRPPPKGGRSGSAVFVDDPEHGPLIIGVLFARVENNATGLATSVDAIRQRWASRTSPKATLCGMSEGRLVPVSDEIQARLAEFRTPIRVLEQQREAYSYLAGPCPPGQPCPIPGWGRPETERSGLFPSLPWRRKPPEQPAGWQADIQKMMDQFKEDLRKQQGLPPVPKPAPEVEPMPENGKRAWYESQWRNVLAIVGAILSTALLAWLPGGMLLRGIVAPLVGKAVTALGGQMFDLVFDRINDDSHEKSTQAIRTVARVVRNGGTTDGT